jgi:AcrR family transcriptional regulator
MDIPQDINATDLAKLRLIQAAITLFAEKGIEATSLRLINREAGARNNSALHYHFGNKLGMIEAAIHFIQDWFEQTREPQLKALELRSKAAPLTVAEIVDALIDPYVVLLESEPWGHDALCALARFEFDGDEAIHQILNQTAGKAARRLRKLLATACPALPKAQLDQRLNLCLLIAIQGFADSKNARHSYIGTVQRGKPNYRKMGALFKGFCVAGLEGA